MQCPIRHLRAVADAPPLVRPLDRQRQLFARVTARLHVPDLLNDLVQIVARRILQRREVDVGLELLQPQRLAHGQEVPVILVSGDSSGERSAYPHESLDLLANGSLEGLAPDVDDLSPDADLVSPSA